MTSFAQEGVNVAGWLTASLGLGEAARNLIAALDAARVPVMPVNSDFTWVPADLERESFASVHPRDAPFPVNLLCVTPPALPPFLADAGRRFSRRYSIGYWFWELSRVPPAWRGALQRVNEVWVASEYVAENLRPLSAVPVNVMRLPVRRPAIRWSPDELDLPPGFRFLFMFDYHSAFERKNPLGVVAAFRRAFPDPAGCSLIVKCLNQQSDPIAHRRLLEASAGRPDIQIRTGYLDGEAKNALLAACDCYVSLHRAEGLALGPAEAMCLGKPVIATGYSGNLEFMDEGNSYLVRYALAPIEHRHPPYDAGGEWAEPDLDHAAELMAVVYQSPADARRRGARAAEDMRMHFSPEITGEAMRLRLESIGRRVRTRLGSPPDRVRTGRHLRVVQVAGLLRQLRDQDAELHELRAQVAALERRLDALGDGGTEP